MHVFNARPTGGKKAHPKVLQPFLTFSLSTAMSGAEVLAGAFNLCISEGLDMMGGADGAALEEPN